MIIMPFGNRTGPAGMGPMTGRGLGYCAGYSVPGYMNRAYGRGMGYGRGLGYGRRFGYGFRGYIAYPPVVPGYSPEQVSENEVVYLKNTARALEEELKAIQNRIKELTEKDKDNKEE